MIKNIFFTALLFFSVLSISAQQISADKYNKQLIHENFDKKGDNFNIITNTDNYFILDKGDFLLSRNNSISEYAIISNNSSVNNFILKTSIRIGPGENKKSSIGIILKAQKDGKGAIIFEINKKREYRIKQLTNKTYKILSGTNKNEGWVNSISLNTVDEHNVVEIRSENNIYDIYVNNKYITTFFVPDYIQGSCGLIISPSTKARISYYHIFIEGEQDLKIASFENKENNDKSKIITSEKLNKRITALELNNLELINLNTTIKQDHDKSIKELNKQNELLLKDLNDFKEKLFLANTNNSELESKTNSLSSKNEKNKNIISDLNKEISLNSSINNELKNDIKTLNSSLKNIKNDLKNLKQKLSLKTSINLDIEEESKKLKSQNNKYITANKQLNIDLNNERILNSESQNTISTLNEKLSLESTISIQLAQKIDLLETENNKLKNNQLLKKLKKEINLTNNELIELRSLKQENIKLINVLNKEIKDLKNLFIKKDFALNGIKPSEIKKINTKNLSKNIILEKAQQYFSVQFGVFMHAQNDSQISNIPEYWYNTTDKGTFVYYSGEFDTQQDAVNRKNNLLKMGYLNAFIVKLNK